MPPAIALYLPEPVPDTIELFKPCPAVTAGRGTEVQAALVRNLALMSPAEREEAQHWVERESER